MYVWIKLDIQIFKIFNILFFENKGSNVVIFYEFYIKIKLNIIKELNKKIIII